MAQARLQAVLTLDNTRFARGIRNSIAQARNLAAQFRRNPISTAFIGGALAATAGIGGIGSAAKTAGSAVLAMGDIGVTGLKVLAGGALAAGLAVAVVAKNAIDSAAEMESLTTQFETLLGSAEAAKGRMDELTKFAAATPFELPEVAAASKKLQILTDGMMATGEGLRTIGDVASGTGYGFEDTATAVGKLFQALRNGGNAGDVLDHLSTDLGVLNGVQRRNIDAMAKSGRGAEAWKMAEAALKRYSGQMAIASQTWAGLMSTFKDSIRAAMVAFGAPIIAALKPTLKAASVIAEGFAGHAKAFGEALGTGLKTAVEIIFAAFREPTILVDPLIALLKAGFLGAGNVLMAAGSAFGTLITSGKFWEAMASSVAGIGMIMQGALVKAFAYATSFLEAGINKIINRLPASLGGSNDGAERQALEAIREHTDKQLKGAKAGQLPGANGGVINTPERAPAQGAERERLLKKKNEITARIEKLGAGFLPETAEDVRKGSSFSGNASAKGGDIMAQGKAMMNGAPADIFDEAVAAFKKTSLTDALGAGAAMEVFTAAVKKAAEKGAALIAKVKEPEEALKLHKDTRKQSEVDFARRFGGFQGEPSFKGALAGRDTSLNHAQSGLGLNFGKRLETSDGKNISDVGRGLTGGAYNQSPLIKGKEKRAAEAAMYAKIAGNRFAETGKFTSARPGGAVRRGDRAAAKAEAQEKLREKDGLDKTNEILAALTTKFDEAWGKGKK